MKRLSAILLLIIFGVSSFSYKTHYCFYKNGTRYHGDCCEYIPQIEKNKIPNQSILFQQKYFCQNFPLEKQFHQQDYSFNNFSDYLFDLPVVEDLRVIIFPASKHHLPVFSCRGGPPISSKSLRGPPFC